MGIGNLKDNMLRIVADKQLAIVCHTGVIGKQRFTERIPHPPPELTIAFVNCIQRLIGEFFRALKVN